LLESARDIGEAGIDISFGHGLIDPRAAVLANSEADENPLGSLTRWIELYRASTVLDDSELIEPADPEPVGDKQGEMSATAVETEDGSVKNTDLEPAFPLLYWLLVPLAPLLWLALRGIRKAKIRAQEQIKGKPQHDSSDH
jgi:hypothetical protein